MSIFSTIGNVLSSGWDAIKGDHSWTDIIGTGLKVGGSLMQSHANTQAADTQYKNDMLSAKSQLIQSQAQLRAAAAQQQEGTYKQIEYNRQASDAYENANRATINAAVKSALIRRAGRETAENAHAAYAASGVVSGTGSAAYVPAFIVGRAEEDAFSSFQEGEDSANQFRKQAESFITAGAQAKQASDIAAAGTREQADALAALAGNMEQIAGQKRSSSNTSNIANLLGTAGSIASQWFS